LGDEKLKKSNFALLLLIVFSMTSCSKVTVVKQDTQLLIREPDFKKSESYYLWGVVGEHHFNTQEICTNGVEQIRTEKTFGNVVLTVITLGIYSPHTAKIWCKGE
jgi:hypothetical protein